MEDPRSQKRDLGHPITLSRRYPGGSHTAPGWFKLGTEEAIEQHHENDAADDDVDFVLLGRKTKDAISDPHDRGRDQKQDAQADDAATVEVTNAVEDRRKPVGRTGNSVEKTIVGLDSMRPPQIQNPPTNTTKAARLTPARSIRLMAISIFRSASDATRSQPSRGSAVDHFHAQRDNDYRENHSENRYTDPDQQTRPHERACQHSQHDRRR